MFLQQRGSYSHLTLKIETDPCLENNPQKIEKICYLIQNIEKPNKFFQQTSRESYCQLVSHPHFHIEDGIFIFVNKTLNYYKYSDEQKLKLNKHIKKLNKAIHNNYNLQQHRLQGNVITPEYYNNLNIFNLKINF